MTPEAQRIAIAEACGWVSKPDKYYYDRIAWSHPSKERDCATVDLPDYLNDLNAMHEAEKVLTAPQSAAYSFALNDVLELPHAFRGSCRSEYLICHATAAQRAEAFLRTIDKWQNDK